MMSNQITPGSQKLGLVLRVIQITDTHLFADADGALLGLKTQHSFEQVLAQITDVEPGADLLIATGDISQDGSAESYQRFAATVAGLDMPWYWIPGNHDQPELMRSLPGLSAMSSGYVQARNWQIILLDSSQPENVAGRISAAELERLDRYLREAEKPGSEVQHSLVCLHHNPLPGEAAWMSNIGLKNTDELVAVLNRYSTVRAVIHGHVHQQRDERAYGLRFICTPSTGIQFKPEATEFELDALAPGWRWFHLYEDGTVHSGVQRLQNFSATIDFESKGY